VLNSEEDCQDMSRHWPWICRISPKVAGSIPVGIIVIFQWHIPSGRTMALRSTPREMNTRNISWG